MDRRQFFQASAIASLASQVLSDVTLARTQTPAPQAATPRRLIMDAYTRHLHWLRTADEIAEAAIEMEELQGFRLTVTDRTKRELVGTPDVLKPRK